MTTRELIDTFTREEGISLFNEKKTDKEVYDILVSKGLTDDYETFCAEAQKVFAEKVSKMSKEEILAQIEGAELTDEQLEMIAGGKNDYERDLAIDVGVSTSIGVVATGMTIAIVLSETIGLTAAAASAFAF